MLEETANLMKAKEKVEKKMERRRDGRGGRNGKGRGRQERGGKGRRKRERRRGGKKKEERKRIEGKKEVRGSIFSSKSHPCDSTSSMKIHLPICLPHLNSKTSHR